MKKLRIAVLISGNGSNLQALIDECKTIGFPAVIARVISNNPDAYGLIRAQAANIPVTVINHKDYPNREAYDEALHQQLLKDNIELVCLAGFMRIVSSQLVQRWHNRLLNIHPSLLPAFKGQNAIEQAFTSGVKLTGCTVHFVRDAVDDGPIIIQSAVPVYEDDTIVSLAERIHEVEHICYPLAVRLIASGRVTVKDEKTVIKSRTPDLPCAISAGGYMNPA